MASRKELFTLLEKFISQEIDLKGLWNKFYIPYSENNWDRFLDDKEKNAFDEIQEKIDFVSDKPTNEDRRFGYISTDEFRTWLKQRTEHFFTAKK